MSYQKCPVCEGNGCIPSRPSYATGTTWVSANVTEICPTCGGQRIINTETGRPPVIKTINFNIETTEKGAVSDDNGNS